MKTQAAVLVFALLAACHSHAPGAATPDAGTAATASNVLPASMPEPARILVSKDRKDLLFTYIDGTGEYHDVSKIEEVPEASRQQVLVRDLSKSPDELHSAEYLYIADLRTPDQNGRFTCGAISRRAFDKHGVDEAASLAAEEQGAETGNLVTVYSASWCGVCKQAKAFLKQHGIPFVDKDIEKDPKAEAELAAKAKARGLRPQGVPVIDVAGELMMGFDAQSLTALLQKKGLSKTL